MSRIARPIRFLLPGLALLCSAALFAGQTSLSDQNQGSGAKFKIAGTIVSALTGAPLGQARVSLVDTANPAMALSMITSENGHFAFNSLNRGKFALQGARRGYLRAGYEQHEQFSTAIVTGAGFNTDNLIVRLTPLALLDGRVLDESGDPVRTANITLYKEDREAGVNRITPAEDALTDDLGAFEFADLSPGNYFLAVSATPWYAVHSGRADKSAPPVDASLDVAYPTTFNNGATDSDAATPIPIKGGDHLEVDVHLNPVPVLHLIFHPPNVDTQGITVPAFQKRVFDSMQMVPNSVAQSVTPGAYELTGVPAGRYSIQLQDPKSGELLQYSDMDLGNDRQELDSFHGVPLSKIKLSVRMPNLEQIPKPFFLALQNARLQTVNYTEVNSAGEAIFENVAPGKYTILVSAAKPYSVVRTSSAGVETSGHDLNVTAGASLELTAFLVGGAVTVEGCARRKDKVAAGVMIALVPKDPQAHLEMFRRDQTDSDGSFVLRGVLPGSYTLVAVQDAWGFAWNQPAVLDRYVQHGQSLTIGELMTGSVHLPDPVQVQPH
jgi:protocatechuate 3,4-dioxygenase beta subunit